MAAHAKRGPRNGLRSTVLIALVMVLGGGLGTWKMGSAQDQAEAAANQPEPIEVVSEAVAVSHEHREVTTSIGTVLATRSVSLRNELAGTVAEVGLRPGQIVGQGALLVALDVTVERAELRALQARAELARSTLARYERMAAQQAASAIEVDNARAERDIAEAEIARVEAIIGRKTIRAPFRAQVGLADVHPGQFLEAGTLLTTLQGVADAVHVDFSVPQSVAGTVAVGDEVQIAVGQDALRSVPARVTAVDARVDPSTRNAMVRARIENAGQRLAPGGSVTVRVPVGPTRAVVTVPASGLRRGPAGEHVFVLEDQGDGGLRAHARWVTAGPVLGRDVIVLSGLEAGERIAAAGSFKLREGVLVSVDPGGGSEPAAALGEAPSESPGASGGGEG